MTGGMPSFFIPGRRRQGLGRRIRRPATGFNLPFAQLARLAKVYRFATGNYSKNLVILAFCGKSKGLVGAWQRL